MYWADYAFAKLGRWHDSKRTGIVDWEALWDGWFTLNKLLEGTKIMQQQIKEMWSRDRPLTQGGWYIYHLISLFYKTII